MGNLFFSTKGVAKLTVQTLSEVLPIKKLGLVIEVEETIENISPKGLPFYMITLYAPFVGEGFGKFVNQEQCIRQNSPNIESLFKEIAARRGQFLPYQSAPSSAWGSSYLSLLNNFFHPSENPDAPQHNIVVADKKTSSASSSTTTLYKERLPSGLNKDKTSVVTSSSFMRSPPSSPIEDSQLQAEDFLSENIKKKHADASWTTPSLVASSSSLSYSLKS
jgi:hypothetical protein